MKNASNDDEKLRRFYESQVLLKFRKFWDEAHTELSPDNPYAFGIVEQWAEKNLIEMSSLFAESVLKQALENEPLLIERKKENSQRKG